MKRALFLLTIVALTLYSNVGFACKITIKTVTPTTPLPNGQLRCIQMNAGELDDIVADVDSGHTGTISICKVGAGICDISSFDNGGFPVSHWGLSGYADPSTMTGKWYATFTSTTGCNAVSDTLNLTAEYYPNNPISGTVKTYNSPVYQSSPGSGIPIFNHICHGDTVILTAGYRGGVWSTGDSALSINYYASSSIYPNFNDSVFYTLASAHGCITKSKIPLEIISRYLGGTLTAPAGLCKGGQVTVHDSYTNSPYFTWTVSDTAVGSIDANTGLFTAKNTGTTVIKFAIDGDTYYRHCPVYDTAIISVGVAPGKQNSVSKTVCPGDTVSVLLHDTDPTTVFNWTNSNTAIGLRQSDTAHNITFVATNAGAYPIFGIITVTPNNYGCNGPLTYDTIKVSAIPTVTVTPVNQQKCSYDIADTIKFSSAFAGVSYSWKNSNISIGLADSGLGNIMPFVIVDSSNHPVTDTITIRPIANGCAGPAKQTYITVNPVPSFSAPASQVLCSGASTVAVHFTGSYVSGTSYRWANSDTSIGLKTGSGDSIASFKTINSKGTQVVDTVSVTPYTALCTGHPQTFTFTVNPAQAAPVISVSAIPYLCFNTKSQYFADSVAPAPGHVYIWTATNATIDSTGTDSMSVLVSFNKSPGNAVITLTDTSLISSCASSASKTITVSTDTSYTVLVIDSADYLVCLGADNVGYQWGYSRKGTLTPILLAGQNSRTYHNTRPDTADFFVLSYRATGCVQKTFYKRGVGLAQVNLMESIEVYPNPAADVIHIKTPGLTDCTARLSDITGRTWITTPVNAANTAVSVAHLEPGIYLLSVYNNAGFVKTFRIVKN